MSITSTLSGGVVTASFIGSPGGTLTQSVVNTEFTRAYNTYFLFPSRVIIQGYSIIGNNAFKDRSNLTYIEISDVTTINSSAFSGCSNYALSIILPETLTEIKANAFYTCNGLSSITIPSSVTNIGNNAFYQCYELTSIVIPPGVSYIGEKAFYQCDKLSSLTMESTQIITLTSANQTTTGIRANAFQGCTNLYYLKIGGIDVISNTNGSKVVTITREIFDNATILTQQNVALLRTLNSSLKLFNYANIINIQQGFETISYRAFYNSNTTTDTMNDSEYSIQLPLYLSYIDESAFQGCSNATSINIPETVNTIKNKAFYGCSKLTSIVIPNLHETIGTSAFENCSLVTSLTMQSYEIGSNAFKGCTSLDSVTILSTDIIRYDDNNNKIVTFNGEGTLEQSRVTLLNTLNSDLRLFTNKRDISYYSKVNAIIQGYDNIGYNAFSDYTGTYGNNVTISSINAIYNFNKRFNSIDIPDSVTQIDFGAFKDNSLLTSVTTEENTSQLVSIGQQAFSNCSQLPSIIIPVNVTSIGQQAFSNCTMLTSIKIPNIIDIYVDTFRDCTQLSSVTIPASVQNIYTTAFYNCSNLTSVTIESLTTNILVNAFQCCTSVTYLKIGSTIVMETDANNEKVITLNGNGSLTQAKFNLLNSLNSYDIYNSKLVLFSGAHKLIIQNYTSIGDSAIYYGDFSQLNYVSIPDSLTSIGKNVFSGFENLTCPIVANNVTFIGEYAFQNCKKVPSLTIKSNSIGIEVNAFIGCSLLRDLTIGTTKVIGYDTNNNRTVTFNGTGILTKSNVEFINTLNSELSLLNNTTWINSPNTAPKKAIILGYTSVGINALQYYSFLTSITIPSSVTKIDSCAFQWCSRLTSFSIQPSSNLVTISDNAFDGCSQLSSITIPSSVTKIGYQAFQDCSRLTSFSILSTSMLTTIDGYAFNRCSQLSSITIPTSVTTIEEGCFYGCNALASITIPNLVTKINVSSFYNCLKLSSITIPSSVTTICETAFYNCNKLTSLTIESNATSILQNAFELCSLLTSITTPKCVTSFEPNNKQVVTLNGTGTLTQNNITLLNTLNSSLSIFRDTKVIIQGYTNIDNNAFQNSSWLTSLEIKEGVQIIGGFGFSNCQYLAAISMPSTMALTSIPLNAFQYCDSLVSITTPNCVTSFEPNNKKVVTLNGIGTLTQNNITLLNTLNSSLSIFRNTKVIIQGYTNIGNNAFQNSSWLTSLEIKEGVQIIGESGFSNCQYLAAISMPSTMPLTSIPLNAFQHNNSLGSITTPNCVTSFEPNNKKVVTLNGTGSLTQTNITLLNTLNSSLRIFSNAEVRIQGYTDISNNAFYGISYFTSIGITSSITKIGYKAFSGCSGLTSIIPIGELQLASIGDYAFENCIRFTSITIPESVTELGNYSFSNCKQLTSFTIPPASKLTKIGSFAFYYCLVLTSIAIPSSVTTIGEAAFSVCEKLTDIVIPEGVTSIDSSVFSYCSKLTSVTIPTKLTNIASYVFYLCSGLASIVIPEGVTNVGQYAFYGCDKLTAVTIPSTSKLATIGDNAFINCSKLSSISLPSGVSSIGVNSFNNCSSLKSVFSQKNIHFGWLVSQPNLSFFGINVNLTIITPEIQNFYVPSVIIFGDVSSFVITDPSSNSTGTFSYTSSNHDVATISGNTVTIVNLGTTTITATQEASGIFVLGTATATVTVNDVQNPIIGALDISEKTYGDPPFDIIEPSSTGPGEFSYTSSHHNVATISGNTVKIVGSGTTTITATQEATRNYFSGSTTALLTVNQPTPANPPNINNAVALLYYITETTAPYANIRGSIKIPDSLKTESSKNLITNQAGGIQITRS